MLRYVTAAVLLLNIALVPGTVPARAADVCVHSWSPSEYKPFAQVQAEVQSHHRGARIISVQLCGRGPAARIRVTIDNGHEIRTITINAK
jgi:hypothetical protein